MSEMTIDSPVGYEVDGFAMGNVVARCKSCDYPVMTGIDYCITCTTPIHEMVRQLQDVVGIMAGQIAEMHSQQSQLIAIIEHNKAKGGFIAKQLLGG
jgi:hypothetical protein